MDFKQTIAKSIFFKHNHYKMFSGQKIVKLFSIGLLLTVIFSNCLFFSPSVQAQTSNTTNNTTNTPTQPPQTTDNGFSHCKVDNILANILCPVAEAAASATDYLFTLLEETVAGNAMSFMSIDEAFVSDAGVKSIWSVFRGIANGLFVVFALILLISYMTGNFISAYNTKRLLPRFLVAIFLVNVSYYITIALVEISNIIGSNLYGLFKTASAAAFQAPNQGEDITSIFGQILLGAAVGTAGVATAVSAASYASFKLPLLAIGLVLLAGIAMTIIVVIALLALRDIIVIIVIAISPIAFVSNVLPNTESFYRLWSKFLSTSLMTYPVVAALFGGSSFASSTITAVAGGSVLLLLMAKAVQVLPIIYAPTLIKNSMAAMPMIGGKLRSMGDKAISGAKSLADRSAPARISKRKAEVRNAKATLGQLETKNPAGKVMNKLGKRTRRFSGSILKAQEARDTLNSRADQVSSALSMNGSQELLDAYTNNRNIDTNNMNEMDLAMLRTNGMIDKDGRITDRAGVGSAAVNFARKDNQYFGGEKYRELMAKLEKDGMSADQIDRINENVIESARQNGRYDLEAMANIRRETGASFNSITDAQYANNVGRIISQKSSTEIAGTSGFAFANGLDRQALEQNLRGNNQLAQLIRDSRNNAGMNIASANNYNSALTNSGHPL